MPGPERTNKPCIVKTFRFPPELVEDMERIIYFTQEGDIPKYNSMTNFLIIALEDLIKKERRELENEGIAWNQLKPGYTKSLKKDIGGSNVKKD